MGGSTVSKSSQYIMLPLGYRLPRKGKQTSTDFSLVMIVLINLIIHTSIRKNHNNVQCNEFHTVLPRLD